MTTNTTESAAERGRRALLHEPEGGDPNKLTLVRALGSLVWDDQGNEYIDCTAQAWSNNLGAGDPRVIAAAAAQLSEITHACPTFHTPVLLELADLLTSIAPNRLDKVGFTLHGSMAVETAFKLALRNRPGRSHILTLQDAYHGRSLTTMAASWPHPNNVFGPLQPRFTRVPHPDVFRPRRGLTPEEDADLCLDLLQDTIDKGIDGGVAAIIYEPIQGNGGHNEFPTNWHRGLRRLCDDNDILLIVDEVQTGFGRTGRMWGCEYYGIEPDMVVFGKGVGGGFPLAGVLARAEHAQFISGDDQLTFGHFPISIAAGLAAVRAILDDRLCERAADQGAYATKRLLQMQDRFELIGDVRCPGLMVSIELVKNRATKEPAPRESAKVLELAQARGVILGESRYAGLGNLIKVKPPLDIPDEQLSRALDVLEEVLEIVQKDSDAGLL